MPGAPADRPLGASRSAHPALVVERCTVCGVDSYPAVGACRRCGARATSPVEATGRGRVVSLTVNHQRWFPQLEIPGVVVLVDLLDHPGVRVVGELDGSAAADAAIGDVVVLTAVEAGPDGPPVPHFTVASDAGGT